MYEDYYPEYRFSTLYLLLKYELLAFVSIVLRNHPNL